MTTGKKYNSEMALNTFFIESRERLQDMESALIEIEKGEYDEELLNLIFRAIHTIKGSSGMFDFDDIVKFTHSVENLLDYIRKGKIQINSEMISQILKFKDHINMMIDAVEDNDGGTLDDEILELSKNYQKTISQYFSGERDKEDVEFKEKYNELTMNSGEESAMNVLNDCWHISLRPSADFFRDRFDPQSIIKYLKTQGQIEYIKLITEAIPSFNEMDPETFYLGFEIDFRCDKTKEEIEDFFSIIREDCSLRIMAPHSSIADYIKLIEELPEENWRIGEILQKIGSLTESELIETLKIQHEASLKKAADVPGKCVGEIMLEENIIQEPVLNVALKRQEIIRKKVSTIKIDSTKLDNLINLIGEIVISGANLKQLSDMDVTDKTRLTESVSVMSRLIEDIRESTMSIRMIQIGETLKMFERVVRDLSKERGKEIDLKITGGETELDKTLIERISDPLMHLIRNAIDHGIDPPEERIKKGQNRRGTISLNAYHETGHIVIEVIDDGDGLDRDKIFNKAVERDFINPDQNISDYELFQFIFEAGFSTAEKITNISGRGVGMDVVKRNIESLRGSIVLESQKGNGTTVRIYLPLTLAIIDGFLVTVGDSFYVLPLDRVIECTEATKEELTTKDGSNIINMRGEMLPYLSLRDFFGENNDAPETANIIVVEYKGAKAGLVVDNLIGEFQTVIKPLGDIFFELNWISGSTILGTGEVAIILDISKLIQNIETKEITNTESILVS